VRSIVRKIIVILGGYPDVGKGLLTATISYLLKINNYSVFPVKFDGYLNNNSEYMNPYEKPPEMKYANEEVFVLDDGFCGDADSGTYERFLDIHLGANHNITGGQLFEQMAKMGKSNSHGEILKIAHLRQICREKLLQLSSNYDFLVVEIGGTIGDEENSYFIETLRDLRDTDVEIVFSVIGPLLSLFPKQDSMISAETKMIRMAVCALNRIGIVPEFLFCRSFGTDELFAKNIKLLEHECNIMRENIFLIPQVKLSYELPAILESQGFLNILTEKIESSKKIISSGYLERFIGKVGEIRGNLNIFVIGETVSCDSFVSLNEAILHAGVHLKHLPELTWRTSKEVIDGSRSTIDGVIITENAGQISNLIMLISKFVSEGIPVLGISKGALPIAAFLTGKKGEMISKRTELFTGASTITLSNEKLVEEYGTQSISERYRCNFHFSKEIQELLAANKEIFGSTGDHPEIIGRISQNILATRAHPEYNSTPNKPNAIISLFVSQCIANQ
jgi:CTP synthase